MMETLHPCAEQRLGDAATDAAVAAGDQGDLAHGVSFLGFLSDRRARCRRRRA
jgi:hypothetical protein